MVMVADVPPMVRMTTGWVVSLLAVAVSGQHPPACRTFSAENIAPGESKGYRCPAEECPGGQVYGTAVYDKDSDICSSALHSGVVTSSAANITIKHSSTPQPVLGTAQNRIVSHSKKGSQPLSVYKVESTAQQEGMVGQVMLVYNFIKEGKGIRFICLSQDQESPISSSRHSKAWDYKDINDIGIHVKSGENSPMLVFEFKTSSNRRAVRSLGSRRDEDVSTTVQYPNAEFQALVATVRASTEENVTIEFLEKEGRSPGQVYIKRLPEAWPSNPSHDSPLRLSPARPSDTGIYIVHDSSVVRDRDMMGAYLEVSVRGCRKGFFGVDCAGRCPSCSNGGQCHDRRGACVCAPGFIGERCQYACPPGFFGNKCQFECRGGSVASRAPQRTEGRRNSEAEEIEEDDGRCKGFTMCSPPPYGCSCAAGFKHPTEPGATCTQSCPEGRYGANCEQRCDGCQDDACDPYSGTCTRGCRRGHSCKEGPPRPGLVLTPLHRGYEASWNAGPDSQARYFVSQQSLRQRGCPPTKATKPRLHFQPVANLTFKAQSLPPYTAYNVCVAASTVAGLGAPDCRTVDTLQEAPEMNITDVSCTETYNTLRCTAQVPGGCASHNGPNVTIKISLHSQSSCPDPLADLQEYAELSGSSGMVTFKNYSAGRTYTGKAAVENAAGTGHARSFSCTTRAKAPPRVRNVTHAVSSDSTISSSWNDPCPPNGEIVSIYVHGEYIPPQPCASAGQYDRCHSIRGSKQGQQYLFEIQVKNRGVYWGPRETYTFIFEEKEPSPPQSIGMTRGARNLDSTSVSPLDPGGTLRNCSITLTHSREPCVITFTEGATPATCKFHGSQEGKIEEAVARCCNTRFCGGDSRQRVATRPLPPLLDGNLHVVRKTNTTITLRFPSVTREGDGNVSVIVFVEAETPNKALDLSAEVRRLFETQHHKTRATRSASGSGGRCGEQVWVAAQSDQDETEFVVGDGNTYRHFENCPLKRGNTYSVGVMGVNELLGAIVYSDPIVKEAVVVEPYDSSPSSLLLSLSSSSSSSVLILSGVSAYYRRLKSPYKSDCMVRRCDDLEQEDADNHELQDTNRIESPPVRVPEDVEENDAIYENLNPAWCADKANQVPSAEVEAYLNKVIGSTEAGEDFRTVPRIVAKSRTAAERPENAAKNRFKNILPYDDTRVVLSRLGDDPFSDYINASHVEGYGSMRYIASQGPKDAKVCTTTDFWRMVVEQRIDVIIMVANFVEMGKKKVSEYFSPEHALNFDGFEVTMSCRKQLPYFTVSTLTVRRNGAARQVQHYHYSKWPDHGVPTEVISIARMLAHFQAHHSHGATVVHCSAGIGRTGAVSQVLLMCEMSSLRGHLSSIEVSARLRMSRALLVENEAQFNLSLEISDEILFGKKMVMSADHLKKFSDGCVLSSGDQYAMAKALPSPLTYNTSNSPVFWPLNRNQAVLPADSNRYYLQPKAGLEVGASQYINAIRIPGIDKNRFMSATEHPMPHTIDNFWRLIAETGSTMVFFINSLEDQDENDYPRMSLGPGETWKSGDYKSKEESAEPYGTWLTHSTLTITSNEDWIHRVDVYQSNNWPSTSSLPPSSHLSLTIAESSHVPRSATAGPPLSCCRDGVTGCGLAAGMTSSVERLQTEQIVDVYRTVVRSSRARHQFIVNEEQFSSLYIGAAIHSDEYSDYGNFQ